MKNTGSLRADEPGRVPAEQGLPSFSKRILLVDDDDVIRRMNVDALTGCGYSVDAAADGASAWEALNAARYDLLITDNNMPRMTGRQLVEKVLAARIGVPVILASGTPPDKKLEMQVAATLLKPYTFAELREAVRNALGEIDTVSKQLEFLQIRWQSEMPPF